MNKQALAQALNHTFHVSSRLLQALITHREGLFPGVNIIKYYPPLESGSILPDNPVIIEKELGKLESLLSQIHWEMQNGHFSKTREEHLWEVQRVTTELKVKNKKIMVTCFLFNCNNIFINFKIKNYPRCLYLQTFYKG